MKFQFKNIYPRLRAIKIRLKKTNTIAILLQHRRENLFFHNAAG